MAGSGHPFRAATIKYVHLPSERDCTSLIFMGGNPCSQKTNHQNETEVCQRTPGQDLWNNMLWENESKIELLGHTKRGHIWPKPKTAVQQQYLIPTVKGGGGNVMSGASSLKQGLASSTSWNPL